jgi:hypothetical protein
MGQVRKGRRIKDANPTPQEHGGIVRIVTRARWKKTDRLQYYHVSKHENQSIQLAVIFCWQDPPYISRPRLSMPETQWGT